MYDEDGTPRYSVIIVSVIAGIAVLLVVFMVANGAAADGAAAEVSFRCSTKEFF